MIKLPDMTRLTELSFEELEILRKYWTYELQKSFYPEHGMPEFDAGECEAHLRLIDKRASEIRKKTNSSQSSTRLPFNFDNPLSFVDDVED